MSDRQSIQRTHASPVNLLDIYSRQLETSAALEVVREQLKAVPDHEQRMRRLEASQAKLFGAAVAVSATVSALGTWLGLVAIPTRTTRDERGTHRHARRGGPVRPGRGNSALFQQTRARNCVPAGAVPSVAARSFRASRKCRAWPRALDHLKLLA